MSEKRFVRIENENGISIKDTETGYERYYAIEVLDDLNDLNDENEQLKDVRENCRNQQVRQANTIHKLLQENEQLREQLANYELAKRNLIKRLNDRKKEDFERFFK